jgi:hypothetical protein
MKAVAVILIALAGAARAGTWETDTFAAYFGANRGDVSRVSRSELPPGLGATHVLVGNLRGALHALLERCDRTSNCAWVGGDIRLGDAGDARIAGIVDLQGAEGPLDEGRAAHAAWPALLIATHAVSANHERDTLALISLAGAVVFTGVVRDVGDTVVSDGSYRLARGTGAQLDIVARVRTEKKRTRCLVEPVETRFVFDGVRYSALDAVPPTHGC